MDFASTFRTFGSGTGAQWAYRWLTLPYRQLRHWSCAQQQTYPISILFYHRVADRELNPWTIDNASFREQIEWLQTHYELLDLDEAQRRLRTRCSPRPAVCITFDDGYAENLEQAIPLLLERRIPCTYFVSWSYVRSQQPFPHDVARGAPLAVNSERSIRALADVGIEIGNHSLSHCDFGQLTARSDIQRELLDSRQQIEDSLGRAVRYFAFPYGQQSNLNSLAFELGAEAGYAGMCSAYGGYNYPQPDPFHLQRIHGDPRCEYLKNWLNFDPRIERKVGYRLPAMRGDRSTSSAQEVATTVN
jgi:peptidoglycan/xylan/chitin deacetylase (PgdA/CDA1 family)